MVKLIGISNVGCLLLPSIQSAKECVEYSTSGKRDNGRDKRPVPREQIAIRAFAAEDRFYAVIFPIDHYAVVSGFWRTPGANVSSRFAEANLNCFDLLEVPTTKDRHANTKFDGPAHRTLRERIISHLERAPLNPRPQQRPSPQDVYLYPTGMASIYKPHTYMLDYYQGTTVLFGMAFMNTVTVFEEFGPGYKFFGNGSDEDLDDLETFLCEECGRGRKVQAIWLEFPANPLLVAPNLGRLRNLADKFNVVLGIDDAVGSWANIDVTAVADILVTSLTKTFNGNADAIGGSAILNPASPKYCELKRIFNQHYAPELYIDDAEAIERNSRDYLFRTAKSNANANKLVNYLHACAQDPNSAVRQVHYPSVNPSGAHYKRYLRPATADFVPGYGCLFSVELDDLATTRAFYENLNVHKGVHFGAPFTLAFACTMCTYKKRLSWAAKYGLRPTQIRIAVGLEKIEVLLEDFRIAVEAANQKKLTA